MLVATDVAARGLDIVDLPAVFNFDVPFNAEDYVHRIGRTGRAGASGLAVTLVSRDDARLVADIEKLIKKKIELEPLELDDDAAPRRAARAPRDDETRRRRATVASRRRGRAAPPRAIRAPPRRAIRSSTSPTRPSATAAEPAWESTAPRRSPRGALAEHQAEEEGRCAVRRQGPGSRRDLTASRSARQRADEHRRHVGRQRRRLGCATARRCRFASSSPAQRQAARSPTSSVDGCSCASSASSSAALR